jgi:hypothetical protein
MLMAITREISPALARCELTHLERTSIDLDKAVLQHAAYEKCVRDFGFTVQRAAALPDLPVQEDPASERTGSLLKDLFLSKERPQLDCQSQISALKVLSTHPSTSADPFKKLYVSDLLHHLLDQLLFAEFKKRESFKIEGNPYIDELEEIIAVIPTPTLEEFKAHVGMNNSAESGDS